MHCKSYSHFFSKKFQHICVSLDVNFNESLTNDVVSFEQLGPDINIIFFVLRKLLLYANNFTLLRKWILEHMKTAKIQTNCADSQVRIFDDCLHNVGPCRRYRTNGEDLGLTRDFTNWSGASPFVYALTVFLSAGYPYCLSQTDIVNQTYFFELVRPFVLSLCVIIMLFILIVSLIVNNFISCHSLDMNFVFNFSTQTIQFKKKTSHLRYIIFLVVQNILANKWPPLPWY